MARRRVLWRLPNQNRVFFNSQSTPPGGYLKYVCFFHWQIINWRGFRFRCQQFHRCANYFDNLFFFAIFVGIVPGSDFAFS